MSLWNTLSDLLQGASNSNTPPSVSHNRPRQTSEVNVHIHNVQRQSNRPPQRNYSNAGSNQRSGNYQEKTYKPQTTNYNGGPQRCNSVPNTTIYHNVVKVPHAQKPGGDASRQNFQKHRQATNKQGTGNGQNSNDRKIIIVRKTTKKIIINNNK
ncbi:hypothetical protein ILUMI_03860 [Ignelater luminosus]|uniref:Uncharacterized protein n=1 Tax=Ignelater luminosus TaxID=2038154 RepID=A0A8K0GHX2_IGNLU|nr:hypothetical protein ILUMI_03860 [Ignelater luminosus]